MNFISLRSFFKFTACPPHTLMQAAFRSHPALKLRLGKEVVQEVWARSNACRGPLLAVGICPAEGKRMRAERRVVVNGGSPAKGQSWGRGQPALGARGEGGSGPAPSAGGPPTPALKGLTGVDRAPHSPLGTSVLGREDLARSMRVPLHQAYGHGRWEERESLGCAGF